MKNFNGNFWFLISVNIRLLKFVNEKIVLEFFLRYIFKLMTELYLFLQVDYCNKNCLSINNCYGALLVEGPSIGGGCKKEDKRM